MPPQQRNNPRNQPEDQLPFNTVVVDPDQNQGQPEEPYHCTKYDNEGISVSNTINGQYKPALRVTTNTVEVPSGWLFRVGGMAIQQLITQITTEVVSSLIRNAETVRNLITALIVSFLSTWIVFNPDGTIEIKGAIDMRGEVTVNNTMSIKNTLNVDGLSTFNQEVMFEDQAVFNSDTTINGKADFTSDVTASGNVDFAGHVDFNNEVNFEDSVGMKKDIDVSGKVILRDNVRVKGNLFTKGSLRVKGGIIEHDGVKHDDDDDDDDDDVTPPPVVPAPDQNQQ
jgi:cytoskeletal protein CcmA (bactofilin family)